MMHLLNLLTKPLLQEDIDSLKNIKIEEIKDVLFSYQIAEKQN